MGSDTTRVSAQAEISPCLRKAAFVMYDVYEYPLGNIHADVRPHVDAIWETWEKPEIIDDPKSGFHARYYEPKAKPGSEGYCPPVLAFRGPETKDEDFANIGVIIDVDLRHDISWLPDCDGFEKKAMESEARAAAIRNPAGRTSRNVLAIIRASGAEPLVIDYLAEGWTRPQLLALFAAAGLTPRQALRETKSPAAELGLLAEDVSDEAILAAMITHPVLVNRPIVVSPRGVRLCRPSEAVLPLLDHPPVGPLYKEDGQMILNEKGEIVA
ncbi:MAG: arsenate reductase family protein [Sphingomonadaceae bacterium]